VQHAATHCDTVQRFGGTGLGVALAVKGGVAVRALSAKVRITSDRFGVGRDGEGAKPDISGRWFI